MQLLNHVEAVHEHVLSDHSERLERALMAHHAGCPAAWAEKVRDCIADLEIALARHRLQAFAPGDLVREIEADRPTQAHPVPELRREFAALVRQAKIIRREAERIVRELPPPGTTRRAGQGERNQAIRHCASIRDRGKAFLKAVRGFQDEEANLVFDSMYNDIGVGD